MNDFLDKTPFAKLLIALLAGILVQYFFSLSAFVLPLVIVGLMAVGTAYFIPPKFRFSFRPLFGIGIFVLTVTAGIFVMHEKQQEVNFRFPGRQQAYIGVVQGIPLLKSRSVACAVQLNDDEKHEIMAYFHPDSSSKALKPGNMVIFYADIRPFRNMGNPDDFDYAGYMMSKGFSGTTYIATSRWNLLPESHVSFYNLSQRARKYLLDFSRELIPDSKSFAVFSALTLGYKDELDDSVKQSFRATGTSHILSVSGLHVGLIYMVIASILGLLLRGRIGLIFQQILIVVVLWTYAFVTGLSPSVVRAALMLSIYCVGKALKRDSFSYNTVFFAAFVMLIYNPFDFFDVGFQLSFSAVLSLCFFLPVIQNWWKPQNKVVQFFWGLFAVSLSVQLGTFPVSLYYFGSFPTYFFLTNLLIVPLATLVMYASVSVYFMAFIAWVFPIVSEYVLYIPVLAVKILLKALLASVSFFETLPNALLQNIHLTLPQAILLCLSIVFLFVFIQNGMSRMLIVSMASFCIFLFVGLPVFGQQQIEGIFVFNRSDKFSIGRVGEPTNFQIDTSSQVSVAFPKIQGTRIAVVRSDIWKGKQAACCFPLDYLILSGRDTLSLYHLNKIFSARQVVLDGTLSSGATRRLKKECEKLALKCYDVKENGAFRVKN